MGSASAFPFARIAAALAAYERNASDAARWAHPSWLAAALALPATPAAGALEGVQAALGQASAAHIAACSRALLRAAGVAAPAFDQLHAPHPAVLDALPVEAGLRVLRMRALLLRRADVRRLIDRRSRVRLAQWVGVPLEQLSVPRVGAGAANAPDVARLVARGELPALEEVDAGRLACEGYALIARDAPAHTAPCALLRLGLPRSLPALPWLGSAADGPDAGGSAQLMARLGELLPEWAWLSG